MWLGFGTMFGQKWISNHGTADARHVWGFMLHGAGITLHDVEQGLDRVLQSGREWPPELPEFLAICRNKPAPRENAAAYREYPVPLPHLKTEDDIARGRAQIAAMRHVAASALLIPTGRRGRARP